MRRGTVEPGSRTAIVTGGTSGIGAEFARALAGYGYALLLVSVDAPAAVDALTGELAARYPGRTVRALHLDLASPGAAATVRSYCAESGLPPVEVLVNNAGIFTFKEMAALPPERVSLYIDLHVRAVTELSLLYGREMAAAGHGYILNMSSMSCWMPMPGIGLYAATKAYIRVFSRSLHLELKESGVRVMVACPGGIATDLFGLPRNLQRLGVRVGALATPRGFVTKALRRMFKGRRQYVNGAVNRLAIVAVSMLPTRARLIVKHKMLDKK